MAKGFLKNAAGHVIMSVKKKFHFLVPVIRHMGDSGVTNTVAGNERHFLPGEHVLDPANEADAAVLNHSWISNDLADGAIESGEAHEARLQAEFAEAQAQADRRKALLEQAKNTFDRATAQGQNAKTAGKVSDDELNRPLSGKPAAAKPTGRKAAPKVTVAADPVGGSPAPNLSEAPISPQSPNAIGEGDGSAEDDLPPDVQEGTEGEQTDENQGAPDNANPNPDLDKPLNQLPKT